MHITKPILLFSLGALALAGCESTGYNAGARTGATTGAIAGGIIGAQANGSNRLLKTAVGAGIGAALGGAIGSTLDAQATELRSDINNPNVGIVNTGEELVVTMPEAITFATDSAVVSPAAQRDLAALANNLLKYPNSSILVVGHTDSTGTVAHNQALSERRATAVANVLMANGVPQWRVATVGRGPHQPIATNATPEGRAMNRRVEIIIRPTN